ncbi:hypothetical protein BC835DRAFT_145109 [Cytidiella melzeri]|nr:hypothetical protein BC835DRAFT_145109 [Cytidiella melzeri]
MFPTEIVDIIVGHLHDDRQSLLSCAAVSPTWSVSSRYHLFHAITIWVPVDINAREEAGLNGAVRTFESPLGSQCRSFVRKCYLASDSGSHYGATECAIELPTLGRLLKMLFRLETLCTMGISWPAPSLDCTAIPTSASVTTLLVCRTEPPLSYDPEPLFRDIKDGLEVLRLLPALKTLGTVRSHWVVGPTPGPGGPTVEPPPFPSELKLENLDLRTTGPARILIDYAINKLDFSSLTSLSIWSFYTEDMPSIGRLLCAAANSLKYLQLRLTNVVFYDFDDEPEPGEICQELCISGCSKLETLQLYVPTDQTISPAIDYVPYLDIASAILATLPLSVRNITLALDTNVQEDDLLDAFDQTAWEDQIRVYQRLPDLKSVAFLSGESTTSQLYKMPSEAMEYVATTLSVLQPQVTLRFDVL